LLLKGIGFEMTRSRFSVAVIAFMLALCCHSLAFSATPTAAISASPSQGIAPLAVFFDGSSSSADTSSYLWDFGDGAVSNAQSPLHTYVVAGTYTATLTVANASGATNSSQIVIVVTGSGQGPVTSNMNFRWAPTSGKIQLNGNGRDKLTLLSTFNTVDLPQKLRGLSASLTINNSFTVSGVIGDQGGFQNPASSRLKYDIQLIPKNQVLQIFIGSADLSQALTGKIGGTLANGKYPVTFELTIGSQSYAVTETFQFIGNTGTYNLKNNLALINEGFFVVASASALENTDGLGHFFEFNAYLSKPNSELLFKPTSGTWIFTFNEATPQVISFDRIRQVGTNIVYTQLNRDEGGIRSFSIDTLARKIVIKTWELPASPAKGGTGLPLRGNLDVGFDFTLRMDLDQPTGITFHAVTATRLTRRSTDDAFWQTGRRNKVQ
jgi:PKD repeat protein